MPPAGAPILSEQDICNEFGQTLKKNNSLTDSLTENHHHEYQKRKN
jgi:hypothetical protein